MKILLGIEGGAGKNIAATGAVAIAAEEHMIDIITAHPTIWEGHATVIDECAQEIAAPDALIVAVGGGGYFCGVAQGIERNKWSKTSIITAETHGTASMHKAIKAQKLISLDKIDSIATSLAAKKVAAKALDYALKHQVSSYTVSDRQSLMA